MIYWLLFNLALFHCTIKVATHKYRPTALHDVSITNPFSAFNCAVFNSSLYVCYMWQWVVWRVYWQCCMEAWPKWIFLCEWQCIDYSRVPVTVVVSYSGFWPRHGKLVGRGGNLAAFSDIFCLDYVGTSLFSQQMARVKSTNHRLLRVHMNLAHNVFITDILFEECVCKPETGLRGLGGSGRLRFPDL
jgi:hypothetical protein